MIDRVLGIDPSWDCSGVASIGPNGMYSDRLPAGYSNHGDVEEDARHMAVMVRRVTAWVDGSIFPGESVLAMIEGPAMMSKFGRPDERAGIRWMIVNQLMARGVRVAYWSPSSLKKYWTDDGRAKKDKMLAYTESRFPDLRVPDHNANDAFALAHAGALSLGLVPRPSPPMVTESSLATIRWPSNL